MIFQRPITQCLTTELAGAGVAASTEVQSNLRRGRHTIAITAGSAAMFVGDENVLNSENPVGVRLKANEVMYFPVSTDRWDQLYVSAKCTLTEFF